jgi:hypothetical protein
MFASLTAGLIKNVVKKNNIKGKHVACIVLSTIVCLFVLFHLATAFPVFELQLLILDTCFSLVFLLFGHMFAFNIIFLDHIFYQPICERSEHG